MQARARLCENETARVFRILLTVNYRLNTATGVTAVPNKGHISATSVSARLTPKEEVTTITETNSENQTEWE